MGLLIDGKWHDKWYDTKSTGGKFERSAAQFRNWVTEDGAPIMGKVPNTKNVYVATGHSCWGILNAPASGAAMAELIADGKVTVVPGFERFAPRRAT